MSKEKMSQEKMSLVTDEIRAKAVIYTDKKEIKEQTQRLLREVGLPNGLLPIDDAEECGHVEETGFVWLKQKKKIEHKFEKVGKLASYGTEVTAYAEPTKIKKLTGVKVKELMMWITLTEISVPVMFGEKVTFKSNFGPSMTYPAEAFMVETEEKKKTVETEEKTKTVEPEEKKTVEPNDEMKTVESNEKNETVQVSEV